MLPNRIKQEVTITFAPDVTEEPSFVDWNGLTTRAREWHRNTSEERNGTYFPWACQCPKMLKPHSMFVFVWGALALTSFIFGCGRTSPLFFVIALLFAGFALLAESNATDRFHSITRPWTTAELVLHFLVSEIEDVRDLVKSQAKAWRWKRLGIIWHIIKVRYTHGVTENTDKTHVCDHCTHKQERHLLINLRKKFLRGNKRIDTAERAAASLKTKYKTLITLLEPPSCRDTFVARADTLLKECATLREQMMEK